jgi:carboxyl-terminal processing protease
LRLANDGELTLTWAMLVSPAGYLLQGHGVVPTLCTDDLADDPSSLELGLRRATAPAPRARATLDEAAWKALRSSCPPRAADNPADVKLALRLLADPALYQEAVHAIAPSSKLAAGVGLTAGGGALSSQQPLP